MAGFKTHITTSTVIGAGYAVAGHLFLGATVPTSLLAGGLCSVSGMLPDLDSDSGVPVREMTAFSAAVIPMLMMDRFRHLGWSQEMMVFVGGLIYVGIRFGVAEIFKRYTVHRGMWHSIPAAAIVGLLAFMVCSCEDMTFRLFKTGAVVLGFLSHLVLDEIWSVQVRHGRLRFKRSFGTALKFWGRSLWGNISVYAKLVLLILVVMGDPVWMERFGIDPQLLERVARQAEPTRPSAQQPPLPQSPADAPPALPPLPGLVPSPVGKQLR